MTSALIDGLLNVISFPNILYVIFGTLIAMVVSFLPGIGMISVASVFLLISTYWPTEQALVFFGAIVGGATFMGSVTGILFNIPGSTPSAVILLDGYPLAQKGYPKKALAASATASAVGSIFGVIVLISILPIAKDYLLLIGPIEKLLISFWALICIVLVTKCQLFLSFYLIILGLVLSSIGLDLDTESPRLTLGIPILTDGIDPIIFLLGFFSISDILGWKKNVLSSKELIYVDNPSDKILDGIKSVFTHIKLTIQSSVIGTIVGIIPGIGGTIASLISYTFASRTKVNNEFGHGDIRGVIAPEAAVDAKDGGSLLPAILLGLPGSEIGIILISVFTIHGIVPGNTMLTSQLPLTLTLILALLISNLLTSTFGLLLINQFVKLKNLNIRFIALPTLAITFLIAYDLRNSWIDLLALIFFGFLGVLFEKHKLPKIPFIVSFILGGFIESNFIITSKLLETEKILSSDRSISVILLSICILSVIFLNSSRDKKLVSQFKMTRNLQVISVMFALTLLFYSLAASMYGSYTLFIYFTAIACTIVLLIIRKNSR